MDVYEPSYLLLKEARESWDHVISDKVVSGPDPVELALNAEGQIAKNYIEGGGWLEIHFVLEFNRDYYFCAIIESLYGDGRSNLRRDRTPYNVLQSKNRSMNGDSSMLVEVAHGVETPQQVAPYGCGISSVIRLKILNDSDCFRRNSESLINECLSAFGIVSVLDRELGPNRAGQSEFCKSPNCLVQGRPQTVEQIPDDERHSIGGLFHGNPDFVPSIFKVVFSLNSAGLTLCKTQDFRVQAIKMFFRPACLEVGIGQTKPALSGGRV